MNHLMTKTPAEIEEESHNTLKLRYNSLAEATLKLQDENRKMQSLLESWKAKLENAQKNVDISKQTVLNLVTSQNKMKDDFVLEINILKEKHKKALEALK